MPETAEDVSSLPLFRNLNLRVEYNDWGWQPEFSRFTTAKSRRAAFARRMAKKTREPLQAFQNMAWCGRCSYPAIKSASVKNVDNLMVCPDCVRWYSHCEGCNRYGGSGTMYWVELPDSNQALRCTKCTNKDFRSCDDCGVMYHRSNWRDHRHLAEVSSCCDSPEKSFVVPNNGKMLKNDKRLKITLPAGEISDEGLDQIRQLVHAQSYEEPLVTSEDFSRSSTWRTLARRLSVLGNQWQTRDGNYPKRLSRLAYKEYGLKVPPKLMTSVGNVGRDHSTAVDYEIEFTRMLNLPARAFSHSESCWWQSYAASRCAFKTNGGFAIRSFNKRTLTGRAWVLPLRWTGTEFKATFNTKNPSAYVVFNGYDNMGGYKPARILSHMAGMTYRKIEFVCDPMYVNSSSGYLIGPEDLISSYTDGRLTLLLSKHSNLHSRESKELVNA